MGLGCAHEVAEKSYRNLYRRNDDEWTILIMFHGGDMQYHKIYGADIDLSPY